ncbi:MAG: hypothetical protein QOI41_5341, partial [Myxococcales bacterium]|nr:hypothetical protein [Myxococcales bacterium]
SNNRKRRLENLVLQAPVAQTRENRSPFFTVNETSLTTGTPF